MLDFKTFLLTVIRSAAQRLDLKRVISKCIVVLISNLGKLLKMIHSIPCFSDLCHLKFVVTVNLLGKSLLSVNVYICVFHYTNQFS